METRSSKRRVRQRNQPAPVKQSKNTPSLKAHIPAVPAELVPITSELGKGRDDPKDFPRTAIFKTVSNVVVCKELPSSLNSAVTMGKLKKNQIKCDCGRAGVSCMSNKNCPCYQVAMRLAKNEKNLLIKGRPITVEEGDFYNKKYFCCSSSCSCKNCLLNPIDAATENINEKVKICRKDQKKGFCVETKKVYKQGQLVGVFTGELRGVKGFEYGSDSENYALLLFDEERNIIKDLEDADIDKEYARHLKAAYRIKSYIDPLNFGNFTRFFNHSCSPNLELIRVFQGGLSPADARICFVTKRVIPSKVELTFDYGCQYNLSSCYCEICLMKDQKKKKTTVSGTTKKRQAEYVEDEIKKPRKTEPIVHDKITPRALPKKVTVQLQPTISLMKTRSKTAAALKSKLLTPEPLRRSKRLEARYNKNADSVTTKEASKEPETRMQTRFQLRKAQLEQEKLNRVGVVTRAMRRLQASTA